MIKQKFFVGDQVHIRPFDMIDTDDLGAITYSDTGCFSISREHIDSQSMAYDCLFVASVEAERGAYVYTMKDEYGRHVPFWWAQGMLEPYREIEMPDENAESLFGFLFTNA